MSTAGGEAGASGLLGPAGMAALDEARSALERAHVGTERMAVREAGWTEREWSFRFSDRSGARRFHVSVPHDGRPVSIRAGDGPLSPPLV